MPYALGLAIGRVPTSTAYRIWLQLRRITDFGHAPSQVFDDWLDMILSAHLSVTDNLARKGPSIDRLDGAHEIRYSRLMARYPEPRSRAGFEGAYDRLVNFVGASQADALGYIFKLACPDRAAECMRATSRSRPRRVTSRSDARTLRFMQFHCYSGSRLIELGKRHPRVELHALDSDETCAKMCAVNLVLFGFTGVVRHILLAGDLHSSRCWRIFRGFVGQIDHQPSVAFSACRPLGGLQSPQCCK
jgi:hypothetical protein